MVFIELSVGSRYPINRSFLRRAIQQVLAEHKVDNVQVSVSVVGKRKIKQLNEGKLHHSGITDVLSFPQYEKRQEDRFPTPEGFPTHLGDIVICFPVAVAQAKRYGKRVDEQIAFYAEHGLLHLLGYHHDE